MYLIKNYHTQEIVAVVTREADARAIATAPRGTKDPVLIYEKSSSTT